MPFMVLIKKLVETDWQVLKEIRLKALAESPLAYGEYYENAIKKNDEVWKSRAQGNDESATFIAFSNHKPAGMVSCFKNENSVQLVAMWADPNFRRVGIGTKLVNKVIEFASEKSIPTVHLWVTVGKTDANSFYTAFGFQATEEFDKLNETSDHKIQKMVYPITCTS